MSFLATVREHSEIIAQLQQYEDVILECGQRIRDCLLRGGKVLLMGNGGSAADAQHIAAEMVVRYQTSRRALPAIALTTDSSILTACSNDFGYEMLFSRQIEALAGSDDIVIGISTSGESNNVVEGLRAAREQQAKTIALTGSSGGSVADLADYTVAVPSGVTARIQEAHILIGHFWCQQIDEAFSGN